MTDSSRIWHLSRQQVNKLAWEACLQEHFPGMLYMQSWYLDIMVPEWEALVQGASSEGPYAAVMALPARKKWGISYLYQPFLTAQLGYVGNDNTEASILSFLEAIPAKFRYWDFCLNEKNPIQIAGYPFFMRKNFVLSLDRPFEIIQRSYSENTTRNIRKTEKQECTTDSRLSLPLALDFYLAHQRVQIRQDDLTRLRLLMKEAEERNQVIAYGIRNRAGDLVSACIFFQQDQRYHYLLPANSEESRGLGASHALVNEFVKDHAGCQAFLDFEGSDIESIAQFYKSFGAEERIYPAIRMNKLPFYLRWMK